MVCRFCGLETGTPLAHESPERCVQALATEVDRVKSLLAQRAGGVLPIRLPNTHTKGDHARGDEEVAAAGVSLGNVRPRSR
jgi:hypothetical protein